MQGNRLNQSSSGLLRMTDDERPFAKDLEDLFSTLVVSLMPLTAHRVRFTKIEHTFLSEDAILNLGSLKFSQSNRMPDPKEPSRIITTTATTTFSMSKEMARSLCQLFLDARFIESADGKHEQVYDMRGTVWQLTPKGATVLNRFCLKNGVQPRQLSELKHLIWDQLITLERDPQTDKTFMDQSTVEVIFSRFVGARAAPSQGAIGVKMTTERAANGKLYQNTFAGKTGIDWLMDYSTIMDRREAIEIASLFIQHNLIELVPKDYASSSNASDSKQFQPTKIAIYTLTQKGRELISGNGLSRKTSEKKDGSTQRCNMKDSNTYRLDKILADPTLRLLFRENLREMLCEENLSFYQDVEEFIRTCKSTMSSLQDADDSVSVNKGKELVTFSYSVYNTFLAPGSPRELNLNHQLRKSLANRMTKAIAQENTIADTLEEVSSLFRDAQDAVFKLMAADSVPKFLQNPKYQYQLVQSGLQ